MIDTTPPIAFIPAALALNLTPGADMMFCVAHGLKGRISAVVFSALPIRLILQERA